MQQRKLLYTSPGDPSVHPYTYSLRCDIRLRRRYFESRDTGSVESFGGLHTSCKERNNIWAGETRIMFIQYGNQNGFCVRPRGEGGVSFEIYTHSPIHSNFHPTPKNLGIFREFCVWVVKFTRIEIHTNFHRSSHRILNGNWLMRF